MCDMTLTPNAVLIGSIVLSALVLIGWFVFRPRVSPAELERRRRLAIHNHGRIRDAEVTDVRDLVVYYTYSVAGVIYTASQDVSTLTEFLPEDPSWLVGPAGVKYSTRNPVDSIVICEEWSGLRVPVIEKTHPAR